MAEASATAYSEIKSGGRGGASKGLNFGGCAEVNGGGDKKGGMYELCGGRNGSK